MRPHVSKYRGQRGISLIESLVAMMILSFGILGLVGLQARLLKASTDAKHRVVAAGLADRLLSHALVDPQHASCYTEPVVTCPATPAGEAARQIVEVWLQDLTQLPSATAESELMTVPGAGGAAGAQQQLRVRVQWQGKGDEAVRQVEAITDVRP
jgi:type IV pilus assembly protein PilV